MNRKTILIAGSIAGVALLSSFALFLPGGAPATTTGSPGDGASCAQSGCHSGAQGTASGWVTSTVPAAGYVPGTLYQVTATNNQTGSGSYGFEVSPQNASGALLGTLAAGTNSKLVGSNKYVTHSSSSSSVSSWTFPWTAPAAGTGTVTFYGAFARNLSGPTTLSTLVVSELNTTGISEHATSGRLIAQNPNNGKFTISLPESMQNSDGTLEILNVAGKSVYKTKYAIKNNKEISVDISHAPRGAYFMVLQNASGNKFEKFILK